MAPSPAPTVGRIVHYQTDQRGGLRYVLPAIVTCTEDSHPQGPASEVPVPTTAADGGVHLHVMTPGAQGAYTELSVPYDDSPDPSPRSWHWPPRA